MYHWYNSSNLQPQGLWFESQPVHKQTNLLIEVVCHLSQSLDDSTSNSDINASFHTLSDSLFTLM
jgi:hypothetical protein